MGAGEKRRLLKGRFYRAYGGDLAQQAAFCVRFAPAQTGKASGLTGQPQQNQASQDTGNSVKANLPIMQFEHLLKHAPPCPRRDKGQQTFDNQNQGERSPNIVHTGVSGSSIGLPGSTV
jgi:hypothetical protein